MLRTSKSLWLAASLLFLSAVAQDPASAEDYVLTVDGVAVELDLGQDQKVTLSNGQTVEVRLRQKDFLTYRGQLTSFEHRNDLKPVRSLLNPAVEQLMLGTARGTGVIVQEYTSLNPEAMIDDMVQSITAEEVKVGYEYSENAMERKVGERWFKGKRVVTSNGGERWEREILAVGDGEKGVLVLTFIEANQADAERPVIEHFWQTMKLAF